MIREGRADAMITGGAEAALCPIAIAGFANSKALTTVEDPNAASLPFDSRRKGFVMLAVAADSESYCMPCGLCRQFISEFSSDIEILSARGDGRYTSYRLSQLLPHPFEAYEG